MSVRKTHVRSCAGGSAHGRAIATGAVIASVLVGCPEPDILTDQTPYLYDHAVTKRFPSNELPWKAQSGVVIDRNLEYVSNGTPTMVQGGLVALAAARDLVFVVFPPEDREGFDIASAGVDSPWSRTAVIDIPVDQIGAVDAVGDGDGNVHMVFRERGGQGTLHYVVYTSAGGIEEEEIPRPSIVPTNSDIATCDDVQLGVTSAGDIDVVFQHYEDVNTRSQAVIARKSAGSSTWSHETLMDTADATDPPLAFWGCRNRLAYDEDWKPMVVVLTSAVSGQEWYHMNVTVLEGADGNFYRGPYEVSTYGSGPWLQPRFDIARAPLGFTVVGHNTDEYNGFLLPTFMHSLKVFADYSSYPDAIFSGERPSSGDGVGLDGGKIVFTPCFTPELWLYPGSDNWNDLTVLYGKPLCEEHFGFAPVLGQTYPAAENPVVTFNHGNDAFQAALCLNELGDMTICRGGYEFNPTALESLEKGIIRVANPEDGLHIVSSSIADGATDVPEDTSSLSITVSDWYEDEASAMLVNVWNDANGVGMGPSIDQDRDTRTINLTFPEGSLSPGVTYLVTLPPHIDSKSYWPDIFGIVQPPPTIRFTVRGEPRDDLWNPREQPIGLTGCVGYDEVGTCYLEVPAEVSFDFLVGFTRSFELDDPSQATLTDPDGMTVPSLEVSSEIYNGAPVLVVTSPEIALASVTYELFVGEVIDTDYGTRLPAEEQTLRIRTGLAMPALVLSNGARDIAPEMAQGQVFDVPLD